MSRTLDEAVKRVVYAANGEPANPSAFDPTPFIPLATSLIDMLRECMAARRAGGATPAGAASQITADAAQPRLRHRIFVRRHLKANLGPQEFRAHGDKYADAVFKALADAKPSELLTLADETHSDL